MCFMAPKLTNHASHLLFVTKVPKFVQAAWFESSMHVNLFAFWDLDSKPIQPPSPPTMVWNPPPLEL